MYSNWFYRYLTMFAVVVALSRASVAQADVFRAGPSYGLTLSHSNDLGSGMLRYTGTLKYGPIRLCTESRRIIHGVQLDTPAVIEYKGFVVADSARELSRRIENKRRSLPKVIDSVYTRSLLSITAVAGYSYIYEAPAAGGMFLNSFDQSGVYGGFILNLDTKMARDRDLSTAKDEEWLSRPPFEWRPYIGVGFTFIQASDADANLDLNQFVGGSDTLTGNVVLSMPATVSVDLMTGVGFTFDRKVSLILGLSLTRLIYEDVSIQTIEEELRKPVSSQLEQGLEMSDFYFSRTNIMLGVSINL